MIKAMCVQKIRDTKGIIIGYELKDESNKLAKVTAADLKNTIKKGQIDVVNLRLTSDNRLVNKKSTAHEYVNTKTIKKTPRNLACCNLINSTLNSIGIKCNIDSWEDGGSDDICLNYYFNKNNSFMIQYYGDNEAYLYGWIEGKDYGDDYIASYELNDNGMGKLKHQVGEWINNLKK